MKSVLEGVSDVCWKRISDFLPAFSSVNRLINGGVSSLLFLSFLNLMLVFVFSSLWLCLLP